MMDIQYHSQSQGRLSRGDGVFRTMYVCICNGVTDSDIRQAAKAGCGGLAELNMRTGCGACCGSCVDTAAEMLEQARAEQKPARDNVAQLPRIHHAACTRPPRTSPPPSRPISTGHASCRERE